MTVSSMPCMIVVSVETGRCGPCCSIAATGRTAMVTSGSMEAYSVVGKSPHQTLLDVTLCSPAWPDL